MSQGTKGASRKYVCLEVDAAIYGQAKAFELPISHIVDEALGRAVHLAANRETIRRNLEKEARSVNAYIEKHGNPMVDLVNMSWPRMRKTKP